jgi:precorrin-3B synthase
MASGDGLLVRVKPPGGVLGAEAARTLAAAAAAYGNGAIDLGNRASLQVRGLRAETAGAFASAIVAAGLAHPEPDGERRRNVIAPPLAGDDPSAAPRAAAIVACIEAMQVRETRLAPLHGKFGVLVDAGGVLPVASAVADIRVLLAGDFAGIVLDGAETAFVCAPGEAANAVLLLSLAFLDLAATLVEPPHRMRGLVAAIGAEAVFAACGFESRAGRPLTPALSHKGRGGSKAFGWLPYFGTGRGAYGAGLPFGATDAGTLLALADLAERHGDGTLRVTPWRAFVFPGVVAPKKLRGDLEALGLIVAADDARTRIAACPGQPTCASATVPTRADAARIAALGLPGMLHVSGCAKGCAHPAAADVVLVGASGRYAIVRNGRAGDPAWQTGLSIADVAKALDPEGMAA